MVKRIVALSVVFALLSLFFVSAKADSTMLVSGSADWTVTSNCKNILHNSYMQHSQIFKDYGNFGQQHIMTNSASNNECMVEYKTSPGSISDSLQKGTHIEFLCYVAEESMTDKLVMAFGDYKTSRTITKGKINRLAIPMYEFTHGSVTLSSIKSSIDFNFIRVGMAKTDGRVDLVFSDIYVSGGEFFEGSDTFDDVNTQRPDGQIWNFGKRVDFEFCQKGNAVPTAKNGSSFAPLSSAQIEVSGETDWKSNIVFTKYLSQNALSGCDGLAFYVMASGNGFQPILTVTVRSLSDGKNYTFTHTAVLKFEGYRRVVVDFPTMTSSPMDQKLSGNILNGVYAIEIALAENIPQTEFSGKFEISDMYTRSNGASKLPKVTPTISQNGTNNRTEMPTMTEENADIMNVADLYSQLRGTNPKNYGHSDYVNLKNFLDAYKNTA